MISGTVRARAGVYQLNKAYFTDATTLTNQHLEPLTSEIVEMTDDELKRLKARSFKVMDGAPLPRIRVTDAVRARIEADPIARQRFERAKQSLDSKREASSDAYAAFLAGIR